MNESAILLTLAVMTCSVAGMIAIWTALGTSHWFPRILVLQGVLALWLIIPAYEILLVLSAESAVVIVAMLTWRFLYQRSETWPERPAPCTRGLQFTLRDLLLAMVAVALASTIAVAVIRGTAHETDNVWQSWSNFATFVRGPFFGRVRLLTPWVVFLIAGAGAGLATLLAVWMILGRRFLRLCAIAATLVTLAIVRMTFGPWLLWDRLVIGGLLPLSLSLIVWLALVRAAGMRIAPDRVPVATPTGKRLALRRAAQALAVLVSLLMVLPLGFVFHRLAIPTPIPKVTLPDPNGYDDLTRAATLLATTTRADALDTARRAFDRESQVPVKYSADDIDVRLSQDFRPLAKAFVAEGELAEQQGRTADALACYLDCVHFAHASARGGLLFDAVYGRALGWFGQRSLHRMHKKLTAEQCCTVIAELQADTDRWEPIEEFVARERIWTQHALYWQDRLYLLLDDWNANASADRQSRINYAFWWGHFARRRLTVTTLALHAYKLQHGGFPRQLADLVPDYLPAVPEDPFRARPLVYRRTETGYMLYSVGEDRKDDGGRPMETAFPKDIGDILLDDEGNTIWAEVSGE